MERNIIVYFGMGFLPEGNAVACRQQAFAQIIKSSGYTPVLIGISKNILWNEYKKEIFDGTLCYSLKYASSLKDKLKDSFIIRKTIFKIFEDLGINRIKCFIMQDYQFNTMKKMDKLCRKKGIAFSADLMDWFTPTRDYPLAKNIFKSFDMFLRDHFLYPFLKNKIYISSKFETRFKNPKNNEVIIPCTCTNLQFEPVQESPRTNTTITFAGQPGFRFQKEKIDWVVKALYENNSSIKMNIIGITRNDFVSRNPDLEKYLTDFIHFHGKIPRDDCLSILKNSDFSVVVRLSNKLTMFGFSSKICESFACGIPVIATDTSDNKKYITDGINGFVCDVNYESTKEMLKNIETIPPMELMQMRINLNQNNPLDTKNYIQSFSLFIENLII